MLTILQGDCLEHLRTLPDESVHCCVTSPPYWGLRDYGCEGQIGLEESLEDWVGKMVAVFREVRRVLRKDGTCWVNLGDSYCSSGGTGHQGKHGDRCNRTHTQRALLSDSAEASGLKPKDLVGQPWRVALALQADGWWLRQDIIWAKPNPMPESIKDRCTKAHEYIFLLTKSDRYFWDFEANQEPVTGTSNPRAKATGVGFGHGYDEMPKPRAKRVPHGWGVGDEPRNAIDLQRDGVHRKARGVNPKAEKGAVNGSRSNESFSSVVCDLVSSRNRRSVWSIQSEPYPEAHFATYPTELPRRCILAGCPVGGVVLDPFGGSGTTGQVALELGRKAVLIELNPEYVKLIHQRCAVTPGLPLSSSTPVSGPRSAMPGNQAA